MAVKAPVFWVGFVLVIKYGVPGKVRGRLRPPPKHVLQTRLFKALYAGGQIMMHGVSVLDIVSIAKSL